MADSVKFHLPAGAGFRVFMCYGFNSPESSGAYNLEEKSSWCDRCIMVSDFPNLPTDGIRFCLPFMFQVFRPARAVTSGGSPQIPDADFTENHLTI